VTHETFQPYVKAITMFAISLILIGAPTIASAQNVVRDHRTPPKMKDHRKYVRDHRAPIVPTTGGGVIVTNKPR
jgi:hypothetical protein